MENKVAKLRDNKVISFALFDGDLSILACVITDGKNPSSGRWKTDEISHTNIPEVIAMLIGGMIICKGKAYNHVRIISYKKRQFLTFPI